MSVSFSLSHKGKRRQVTVSSPASVESLSAALSSHFPGVTVVGIEHGQNSCRPILTFCSRFHGGSTLSTFQAPRCFHRKRANTSGLRRTNRHRVKHRTFPRHPIDFCKRQERSCWSCVLARPPTCVLYLRFPLQHRARNVFYACHAQSASGP